MIKTLSKISILVFSFAPFSVLFAQDTVRYIGDKLVNIDYHDGRLVPAVGVHNIQVMRANREHPEESDGFGWTYNHQPMLAYWNNQFFLEYLSNPVGEHVPPGQTYLCTSPDGYNWSKPTVVFPEYKIPDGTTKEGRTEVAKDAYAVNHQRMGFYVTSNGRLLVLAFYGLIIGPHDDPNDGNGVGRVVREIYKDGSFGPIYFIRYNHAFNQKNTSFPFYTASKDKGFVAGCNELLAKPLITQQWNEEADRNDPLITLKKDYKAFNYYHLPDGRVVGLWKNALTAISTDEGKTWPENASRAPKFVNSNAKIWGQKTSDGKYATVYNPSEFRWPLAVSVSKDGLNYDQLLLVNGEITSMRYGGAYKSYGPQYVRGIIEGNGTPPGGNMWVGYSMNKEDIWVAEIPVPITDQVTVDANDNFNSMPDDHELDKWNYNSGRWTPVTIDKTSTGIKALSLKDWDPFDYAVAERVIPSTKHLEAAISVMPMQNHTGELNIEFRDSVGTAGVRITLDTAGNILTKAGYRYRTIGKYTPGEMLNFSFVLDTDTRFYYIELNGKKLSPGLFFAPLASISRVQFRTGEVRRFPNADTPTDQMYDLPDGGHKDPVAAYFITSFKTGSK